MKFIDEKTPFTCAITGEYCGGEIQNITIDVENKTISSIPISIHITNRVNRKFIVNLEQYIIQNLGKKS